MKKIVLIFAIAVVPFTILLSGCTPPSDKTKTEKKATRYQCPMDCESGKTYANPGKCPVCEMTLEPNVEI
jgi:uncharacterized protein YceK